MTTVFFHATLSLREEWLPDGAHTSLILRKGQILYLIDIDGGANISMMMLNPHEKSERLNLPDTLKGQHAARLTVGHCFYSDMGRVLVGIVVDNCSWHNPFGGVPNTEETHDKYGARHYQELHNGFYRNGADNLPVETGRQDLSLEDLLIVVNFFSKVTVDDEGRFQFVVGNSCVGDYVELFASMDVLLMFIALPHPRDPAAEYAPCLVQLSQYQVDGEDAVIQALLTRDENQRAFHNTQLFVL